MWPKEIIMCEFQILEHVSVMLIDLDTHHEIEVFDMDNQKI